MDEPRGLSIRLLEANYRCTLVLRGELDVASGPRLLGATRRLCGEGARQLILDMSELDFIDLAGLQTIMIAQGICREFMIDFGLFPGRGSPRRLLQLSGLFDALPIRERPQDGVTGF